MLECVEIAERAARAAGEVLLDWLGRIQAREKGPKDLVTEADLAAQRVIRKMLLDAFPQHGFVGEEDDPQQTAQQSGSTSGLRWIVDPLDGTANYVHQLPAFSVSIGLWEGNQPRLGVVYDPRLDECFTASDEGPATCNGEPIACSECVDMREALAAASFSADVPRGSIEVARFVEVLHASQALRRLGSAALNLSYVAAGRLDLYWATSVKPWDVAAGVLLVQRAGGVVTDIDGGPFRLEQPRFAAAANDVLHRQLLELLRQAETPGP